MSLAPPSRPQAPPQDGDLLATQLGEMARQLQAEQDTGAMLDDLVRAAVALIPGTDEGSISVVVGRRDVNSQSPTGDLPLRVDELQSAVGQGPCVDAAYEHETVRVPDMAHDPRWPQFAPAAAALGAASMLCFQLYVEGDNLGALNLYGRRAGSFDEHSEHVGLIFASHAAVAFAEAQKLDQLAQGLASRDLIGQAKGILMERYGIDAAQAFSVLTRVSQAENRKLHAVATELVARRRLPGQL